MRSEDIRSIDPVAVLCSRPEGHPRLELWTSIDPAELEGLTSDPLDSLDLFRCDAVVMVPGLGLFCLVDGMLVAHSTIVRTFYRPSAVAMAPTPPISRMAP